MKILLSLIIVIGFGYVGYGISNYYTKRKSFFYALIQFMQGLKSKIAFSQTKLSEIFTDNEITNKSLKTLCENYKSFLMNNQQTLEKTMLFRGITFLRDDEKEMVFVFMNSLGRGDVKTQIDLTNATLDGVNFLKNTAEQEKQKYGKLALKLAILFALALVLVLI